MAYRVTTALVALHSLLLGGGLLLAPIGVLELTGWEYAGPLFFPKQSGCFLLVMGVIYAAAVTRRSHAWVIVWSKLAAAVFLLTMYQQGIGPVQTLWAGLLDGAMGVATALTSRGAGSAGPRSRPPATPAATP